MLKFLIYTYVVTWLVPTELGGAVPQAGLRTPTDVHVAGI